MFGGSNLKKDEPPMSAMLCTNEEKLTGRKSSTMFKIQYLVIP